MDGGAVRSRPAALHQAQDLVRSTFALASLKIRFLDDLPYILGRLHTPGIIAKCIELFNAHPAICHDSVTLAFMMPGSPLRAAVDNIDERGGNISPELEAEIDSIRFAPLDDTVAERPPCRC